MDTYRQRGTITQKGIGSMGKLKADITELALLCDVQVMYVFGSRAREIQDLVEGRRGALAQTRSDVDIGVKTRRPLTIKEKVKMALAFEDLFGVPRVDLVFLDEAPSLLALEIVKGELLYARNPVYEAEYQLYIMRRAADLIPYERMKNKMLLEEAR
jgi:uncharacterized protein